MGLIRFVLIVVRGVLSDAAEPAVEEAFPAIVHRSETGRMGNVSPSLWPARRVFRTSFVWRS